MILQGVSEVASMELRRGIGTRISIKAYLDRLCHDISDWFRQTAPGLVLWDIHRSALLCHLDCEKETENDFEKKISHTSGFCHREFSVEITEHDASKTSSELNKNIDLEVLGESKSHGF